MDGFPRITKIFVDTFNNLATQFADFTPRLIYCIVILILGYFLARIISMVVKNILERVGFDKIGNRLNEISIIKQLKTEIKLSEIISKVLYYFVLLIFLPIATETLGVAAITDMVLSLVGFIPSIIAAAIMLQVGILLADAVKGAVITLCRSFNVPSARLVGNLVFAFFVIITLISALGQIGINTELIESSFIMLIGGVVMAFSLGYGIASRDVLSNMISSFYSRNKYREGQRIRIDQMEGVITKIDNMSVTIQNEDRYTIIPLQLFQSKTVEIFA
jgi:hypothetical protein